MKRPIHLLFLFVLSAHWTAADTVNLNPSADTWIFAEAPENNMGAATDFAAGINAHESQMRALLRFDLQSIPPNATITSAELRLTVVRQHVIAPSATFDLHRVSESWGEGSGSGLTGEAATSGAATWLARFHSTSTWTSAGGLFNGTVSASVLVTGVNTYSFGSTAGMVADVQGWISNPGSNFGWLLKDRTESTAFTARRWASNQGSSGKPTLIISYTVPAPAPAISGVIRTNNQLQFAFSAEPNRSYTVKSKGTLTSGEWSPLTNFSAPSVATNLIVSDTLSSSNRFYRVRSP